MEKPTPYYEKNNLEGFIIVEVSIKNERFSIIYSNDKEKKEFLFDDIYAYNYAIENGSIDRFSKYPDNSLVGHCVFTLSDSKYFKEFEHEVSGTRSMSNVKHFLFIDRFDTVVDVLATCDPVIL